jgi:peptidyl-prolyl cis-trans isomerase D
MAFNQLVMQALLLNLADEYGIVVSDEELANYIATIPSFQNGGSFDHKIYETYLKRRGMKAKSFEAIIRDDLINSKLMRMLNMPAVPFEIEAVSSALKISDKIRYRVVTRKDVNITADDETLKKFWESRKSRYMTPKKFKLSILWTDTKNISVDEKDLKDFYTKNSYNYIDAEGKTVEFEKVREKVVHDYRMKKGKKQALLDFIAFKKGKKEADSVKELEEGDALLPAALWKEIKSAAAGRLVKPKIAGNRYASVRIDAVIPPKVMSFEEARKRVEKDWLQKAVDRAMDNMASKILKERSMMRDESDYLSLEKITPLPPLNLQETTKFVQKLFTSGQKEGIIAISDNRVIYEIVDQKLKREKVTESKELHKKIDQIKMAEFERALLKELSGKYSVTSFRKGL